MIIDQELKTLIPPLTQEEYEGLENSLLAEGCRDSLTVWREEDILLDGHNRYEICQKHNILFQVKYISLPDRASAEIWIIQNQLHRRNINDYQRVELALKLETKLKAKAKENQQLSQGRGQKGLPNLANLNSINTREEIAKSAGVSHGTLDKVKIIQEQGIEPLQDMVRGGEISINAASSIAKASEEEQQAILALSEKEIIAKAQELAAQYKAERDAAEKREQEKQMTITTLEDRIAALEENRTRFEKDRTRLEENLTRVRAENDQAKRNKAADDACIIRQEENYRQKLEEIEKRNQQIENLTKHIEELKSQVAEPQTIEKEVKVEVEKRVEVIPEDYDMLKGEVSALKEKLQTSRQKAGEELSQYQERIKELAEKLAKKEHILAQFDAEQKQLKALGKLSEGLNCLTQAYNLFGGTITSQPRVKTNIDNLLQSIQQILNKFLQETNTIDSEAMEVNYV